MPTLKMTKFDLSVTLTSGRWLGLNANSAKLTKNGLGNLVGF